MCFRCLVAFQARELTGAYESSVEGVTDRPLRASVVYRGESLCDRHVNTVRGLPANFLRYPEDEETVLVEFAHGVQEQDDLWHPDTSGPPETDVPDDPARRDIGANSTQETT